MISIKGRSETTVKGYYWDLRTFYKFLAKKHKLTLEEDFEKIEIKVIDIEVIKKVNILDLHSFISFLGKVRKNGNKAKARKISSLKSYFRYLNDTVSLITNNPTVKLETPKNNSRLPVHLTLNESNKLLDSIDDRDKIRNFAIVLIFLTCGVRLSELTGINISKLKGNTLTVIGKGDKERTIYLSDICLKSIKQYLKVRPEAKIGHEDAMFLSNQKKRISNRAVENLVDKYIKKAGLDINKLSPHKLRHTSATLMYQYGNVDIRTLQSILGHESVATTQIYTHINETKLKEAVMKNPISNYKSQSKREETKNSKKNS